MTPDKIEEKLLEYRRRKEKEREAELRAAKPLWERVLPEKISVAIKSNVLAPSQPDPPSNEIPAESCDENQRTISGSESSTFDLPSPQRRRNRLTQPKRTHLSNKQQV